MNCKPGDLAIVIGGSQYAGLIFEVLYLAPQVPFRLPDGVLHKACDANTWVLKVAGSPVIAPVTYKAGLGKRTTIYGCGKDSKLHPIRGDDKEESVDISAPVDCEVLTR